LLERKYFLSFIFTDTLHTGPKPLSKGWSVDCSSLPGLEMELGIFCILYLRGFAQAGDLLVFILFSRRPSAEPRQVYLEPILRLRVTTPAL
jgi:hypothetical protein